ncbi:f-box domain-containing protein [Stemphylium lycopersici]|uniref:F-box domain-containing protein n=1 Tax=Stemphylium lycopersici TaxID=183478 RepID=A0A364NE96_STELY|nr:f-box domain-containing protein [Stemphylium lycopersici]RAR10902.1 f-box domain-containing protein [Stemphylium lycopersici]RAR15645.1 f-box domain-containing protein [Stemphylium lycopersici]
MGILNLADELLRIILEYVASEPEKPISLERRAYLSQESFKLPVPHDNNQAQTIAAFRLTCRKFSDLGVIHQFARVTTRFSQRGLDRLEKIAGQPHIARRVKKFSYMVPFFYDEGRERMQELLRTQPESFGLIDVRHFQEKANEQRDIVRTRRDALVLNSALRQFTSLQHIQILRVQDQEEGELINYMRNHELNDLVPRWPPACLHSAKTIGQALLKSGSPCSRISSPMLSPQSVLGAAENPPTTLGILAGRLTCLELHFDDSTDLDIRMRNLSSLSKALFTAAKNIEALHIGFPSYRPLTLRLEELFHHVKWDKLQAFGIQAWRLDAEEIIGMAYRHRETLRGLRLRDVLLREGSRWKDVLPCLRDDLPRLDWVSLRRIDYEQHFDEQWVLGAEVPDDPLIGSDSSDESEDWEYEGEQEDPSDDHSGSENDPDGSSIAGTESDAGIDEQELEPEQGGTLHFPPMPDTPASITWCNCNGHMDSVDALGDDGVMVTNQQRKFWEKWVVRKICTEQHGHK